MDSLWLRCDGTDSSDLWTECLTVFQGPRPRDLTDLEAQVLTLSLAKRLGWTLVGDTRDLETLAYCPRHSPDEIALHHRSSLAVRS